MPAPVAGSAKVYRGSDGIRVSLARLADDSFLVRVTGTTHALDGKVLRCSFLRDSDMEQAWVTPYDGYDLWILKRQKTRRGHQEYLLNMPGEQFIHNMRVEYDDSASASLAPSELAGQHEAQLADGTLAPLLRFDVAKFVKEQENQLSKDAARVNKVCGTRLRFTVNWEAISEKTRRSLNVRDLCYDVLTGVRRFCELGLVQATLKKHLAEVRCHADSGDRMEVKLEGQILHYTVGREMKNRSPKAIRLVSEAVRWPDGETLARMAYRERTQFCTDDKGNYVGWRPTRDPDRFQDDHRRIFFGTQGRFRRVPFDRNIGEAWFFDPRFPSSWDAIPGRRGRLDHHSTLRWGKAEEEHCTLYCGKRQTRLRRLTLEETAKVLENARWDPPLARREPHGLARDRKGVYFYVDKAAGEGVKDYRLYRGPLGRMVQLQMLNIVSDSQGEVYSTKNGTLRLVLEKETSFWVERGKKNELVNVPIAKNLSLIYNELGVYLAQPFGTPCDLF